MGGPMTYIVVRTGKQGHGVPAQRVDTFWVVLSGSGPLLPLVVDLPGGREALALFSGEEEARMFCSLREEGKADSHLRETSVGEVISLLYCLTAASTWRLIPSPRSWEAGSWDLSRSIGSASPGASRVSKLRVSLERGLLSPHIYPQANLRLLGVGSRSGGQSAIRAGAIS